MGDQALARMRAVLAADGAAGKLQMPWKSSATAPRTGAAADEKAGARPRTPRPAALLSSVSVEFELHADL